MVVGRKEEDRNNMVCEAERTGKQSGCGLLGCLSERVCWLSPLYLPLVCFELRFTRFAMFFAVSCADLPVKKCGWTKDGMSGWLVEI